MKRSGPTNIIARKTADLLVKESKKNGASVWTRVAELLLKSTRSRPVVNISKINRYAKEGELVVVPGKVLGAGRLDKKVVVAAFSFSQLAVEKIKAAGGEAITLEEAVKRNPRGSNVRIIV